MGLFDTIGGNVNCPYCGEVQQIEIQTKKLYPQQNSYNRGSLLKGGPFLNGEYALFHNVKCKNCSKEFSNSFVINNQEITDIKSYTVENHNNKDFIIKINKSELIELIRKNCLTTIIVTSNPSKINDHKDEQYLYYYAFKQLTDYVHLFKHRFGEDVTNEEFINSIFNNLENSLDKKYLLELNIDLSQFQEEKIKNSNYKSILDEYKYSDLISSKSEDDLIKYLKKIVSENVNDVKNRVERFYVTGNS